MMPSLPVDFLVPNGTPTRVRDLVGWVKLSEGEQRTYAPYLPILKDGWVSPDGKTYDGVGDLFVHQVLPAQLTELLEAVRLRAVATADRLNDNRETSGRKVRRSKGESAVCNAYYAFRKVFAYATANRFLARGYDPTDQMKPPKRTFSNRRPLTSEQLKDMWTLILNGGDDPELDAMMCQFILITGARREGVINLNVRDVDAFTGMVHLDEKNDQWSEQPAPDWLIAQLLGFAASRGSIAPGEPIFRYKPGRKGRAGNPAALGRVGSSRFDTLFGRLQASAEWADDAGLCAHLLRHHGHAVVERRFGVRIAEKWARHRPDNVSQLYGVATTTEVARVVIQLYGGSHPLA